MSLVIPTIVRATLIRPTIVTPTIVDNLGQLSLDPKVYFSRVTPLNVNAIIATFNKSMEMTCDIKNQINVVIDGAPPIHPVSANFVSGSTSKIEILMATPFLSGQVVSWSYDDTGSCQLREAATSTILLPPINNPVIIRILGAFSIDYSTGFF